MASIGRRSPLALAVLALVLEAPMHPYEMQRLIKERHKDNVINVGWRTSLYKVIGRLRRDGLIAVREIVRDSHRPDRTVYEVTDAGRETASIWVCEMLSDPRSEFPEFPAAVAHLPLIDTARAIERMEMRRLRLAEHLEKIETDLAIGSQFLPRLMQLEDEYRKSLIGAELEWISAVIADLRNGKLFWTPELITEIATTFLVREEQRPFCT